MTELGIDVDAGDAEVERCFVASTLVGNRIAARVAERTFDWLDRAGIGRNVDAGSFNWDRLVALPDASGCGRYDYRTATRLQALADLVADRHGGDIAGIDNLPGWGPTTVGLSLRELRGLWPGVRLPRDPQAGEAGRHLGMFRRHGGDQFVGLASIAAHAGFDDGDPEAAFVRLALTHRRKAACPGGPRCVVLVEKTAATRDREHGRATRPSPRSTIGA